MLYDPWRPLNNGVLLAAAGLKGRRQRSNPQRAYRRPRQKADSKIRPVPTLPLGVRYNPEKTVTFMYLFLRVKSICGDMKH